MPTLSGIFRSDSRFAPSNCPVSTPGASVPPSLRRSVSPVLATRCLMGADSVFVLEERRLFFVGDLACGECIAGPPQARAGGYSQ